MVFEFFCSTNLTTYLVNILPRIKSAKALTDYSMYLYQRNNRKLFCIFERLRDTVILIGIKSHIMKDPTIFITYNPNNNLEQTLAVRLHTIGAVSGFRMYLPDRYNSISVIDSETKRRINEAEYFIMFSTQKLSKIVLDEINYAFNQWKDKSKIIVIYNKKVGKNLSGANTNQFTALHFDPFKDNQEELVMNILDAIRSKEKRKTKKIREENQALKALLGIGIGLYVLSSLSPD